MNVPGERSPIPAGKVSSIRGRWQSPGLISITRFVLALGVLSAFVPGDAGRAIGIVAVSAVIAVPLLRVGWLVFRWGQEHDARFVAIGLCLLGIVGVGALLSALGVGS